MSKMKRVADKDRIPKVQKAAFSLGYGVDYMAVGLTTGVLWMPFFNIGLGISPAVLGLLLMLFRAWDAITDPVMGNISDNTRTPFGRRRPYIALGAVLTAFAYLCLWRLPANFAGQSQILVLAGLGLVFFTCYTMWSVPFYSLQMELTPNYDERTRLAACVAIVGKFIYLGGGWIMALATCSRFINAETGKPDLVLGMRTISWFIAGLVLVLGMLPALFVKERYYKKVVSSGHRTPFWKSVRESFQCKPLWFLIGISFFMILGSGISNMLGQYVSIYILNDGNLSAASVLNGWRSTGIMIFGVCGIPLWTWLSERFDKKKIVTFMLSGSIVGHLLNIVFLRPEMPYLWLISAVFETGAIGAVWMFIPSMKADVADYDEMSTEERREGSLNSFYSWFAKLASTVGAGLGGFVLQLSGFSAKLPAQTPDVLFRMKWLYIALPFLLWGCTLFFIFRYPLTRERLAQIRAQLEARRGDV